jgi:hypothetical protein
MFSFVSERLQREQLQAVFLLFLTDYRGIKSEGRKKIPTTVTVSTPQESAF